MNIVESKGYAPEFDFDVPYGEEGQAMLIGALTGPVEVKRDRRWARERGTLYFEYEQNPGRRGEWTPSGVHPFNVKTKADWFFYWITDDYVVGMRMDALRAALGLCKGRGVGRRVEERDGDNPTRGYSVPIDELRAVFCELGLEKVAA